MFCVTRKRRIESTVLNQITARMTRPCCQGWLSQLWFWVVPRNWSMVITRSPVATMTSTPGHQAQKPAKKPAKLPSALLVQT